MGNFYIGVDVQAKRGCPYAVLDESARMIASGWISNHGSYKDVISNLSLNYPNACIGIDSPRQPLPAPRDWYWRRDGWRKRTTEVGFGRHCEVVIKAHNIANPQWTPIAGTSPEWMKIGFALFEHFQNRSFQTYEAFPSASYRLLRNSPEVCASLSFENFQPGPKDMLDAVICALTVLEFKKGLGCEVGGGDGLGTIILPRPIKNPIDGVLTWPASNSLSGK